MTLNTNQTISGTKTFSNTINGTTSGNQAILVSGTNIKTVNSTSLLGSGNISVQPTLVSGTNIKTINSTSLLGSGNISINTGTAYLKSVYVSGTSGYNIWSNGYCEQWGKSTTSAQSTITLTKTYSNTNYNLVVGGGDNGGTWPYGRINSTNTILIGCRGTSGFSQPTYWKTSGYLANGQY